MPYVTFFSSEAATWLSWFAQELNEQIQALGQQAEAGHAELVEARKTVADLRLQLAALLDEHQLRCDSESQLQSQVLEQQKSIQMKEGEVFACLLACLLHLTGWTTAHAEAVEGELIACQSQREQDMLDAQQQRQALQAATTEHSSLTQQLEVNKGAGTHNAC